MTEQAKVTLQKNVPWRRGLAWWVVAVEGGLLLAAGLYIVISPDSAKDAVRVLIGAFLLANCVGMMMAAFKPEASSNPATPYRTLAAGSGLTVGILVVLQPWSDYLTDDAARVILALGLLSYGGIGLVGAFMTRDTGGMRRGPIISGALNVLFAGLLLYNVHKNTLDMRWFGFAAIAGGVLLCGYAFAQYRARQATPETVANSETEATRGPMTSPALGPPPPNAPSPSPVTPEPFIVPPDSAQSETADG